MNTISPSPSRHASKQPPTLAVVEPHPESSPRRILRALDRSGEEFYFMPDQVASISPVREGACCVRLRQGRLIILNVTPRAAAQFVWGAVA